MKNIIAVLAVVTTMAAISLTSYAIYGLRHMSAAQLNSSKKPLPALAADAQQPISPDIYEVYVDNTKTAQFSTYDAALAYAQDYERAAIKKKSHPEWLWDNYLPYDVFVDDQHNYTEFETFAQAVAYARGKNRAYIYYRKDNNLIWASAEKPKEACQIEGVPLISQTPELPRGCEVTSLAMLIQFYGVHVDKLTLAEQIAKDPSPREWKNGKLHWGNPNTGFVGDMYSTEKKGFGVYHAPIHDLLTRYFPRAALDLTGCEFEDILHFINSGAPVWVVANTSFDRLPKTSFLTWQTETGEVSTTYLEHAVVVTGYDKRHVYFNDPLGNAGSAARGSFIAAWEQMGRQAVAVSN